MGKIGMTEIILILLVVVLLFGGRKIPELMKGIGQGMKEFKKHQRLTVTLIAKKLPNRVFKILILSKGLLNRPFFIPLFFAPNPLRWAKPVRISDSFLPD